MIFNVKTQSTALQIWKQERLVAYIEAYSGAETTIDFWSSVHGSALAPFAKYKTQADGKCYIDLTDYVRAYPSVSTLNFGDSSEHQEYEIECEVVGLINPAGVLIPHHALEDDCIMLPPSRIIEPVGSATIRVGFYKKDSAPFYFKKLDNSTGVTAVDGATIPAAYTGGFMLYKRTGKRMTYAYIPQVCDHAYAMVRWVSLTGVTRCHTFEMVKETTESASAYSLLPVDNEYVTIKGRKDGMTMRIEGLTPYDVWYYADVLTSSKVEVSLDGSTWVQVDVETKNATIPEGTSANNKFEFKVGYKRYDAVAM